MTQCLLLPMYISQHERKILQGFHRIGSSMTAEAIIRWNQLKSENVAAKTAEESRQRYFSWLQQHQHYPDKMPWLGNSTFPAMIVWS